MSKWAIYKKQTRITRPVVIGELGDCEAALEKRLKHSKYVWRGNSVNGGWYDLSSKYPVKLYIAMY